MAFFSKVKRINYPSKMHGYPQFSFRIPRALAKFFFLRIVLNRARFKTMRGSNFTDQPSNVGCYFVKMFKSFLAHFTLGKETFTRFLVELY